MSEKKLEQLVDEIHKALIGDEYREEGLIQTVSKQGKRIDRIEKYIYAGAGIYTFILFALTYGDELLKILK